MDSLEKGCRDKMLAIYFEQLDMDETEHKDSWELECMEARPEGPLEEVDQLAWDKLTPSLL